MRVPVRGSACLGVVWAINTNPKTDFQIRDIYERLDGYALDATQRKFITWVAQYTMSPLGMVLKMALSVPKALEAVKPDIGYILAEVDVTKRLSDPRKKVINTLQDIDMPLAVGDIALRANVGRHIVQGMVKSNMLTGQAMAEQVKNLSYKSVPLSAEQQASADTLCDAYGAGYDVMLLDGVTGSGKTEVYFELVAKALAAGQQSLVLLPEIALSTQWLQRFEQRFGAPPTVWHSELTEAKRRQNWRDVMSGKAKIVVGARSALFLPYKDLGCIVVDEEHEGSFKQEEGVLYHARDMAIMRAKMGGIPIVLSTATPSLETEANCASGRYKRVKLSSRHGQAVMPTVELVDLRQIEKETPRKWISPPLRTAVHHALSQDQQVMLFLNRRGYAPLTLCHTCGSQVQCPYCTAWMVEHRRHHTLLCHFCGFTQKIPQDCNHCQAKESYITCGPGVERVAEEAESLFPDKRIEIMSSDTMTSAAKQAALVTAMQHGKIDVLVGTQMMAKGHHFPNLTLVGVVDADIGLSGVDLRGCERTYQMLHQVSGRAGRADKPGKVLLQTFHPDHPVMQALESGDRDTFVQVEMSQREMQGLPPYGRLAAIVISGKQEAVVEQTAVQLARSAPRDTEAQILGPAPSPIAKVRNAYRWRLLVKAPKSFAMQQFLSGWLSHVNVPKLVTVKVDIDPYNFL